MDTDLFALDQPDLLRLAFGGALIALFAIFCIVAACATRLSRSRASGHAGRIGRSLRIPGVEHA